MKLIAKVTSGLLLASAILATGCMYGGVATTPDNKVVVLRNDMFLGGLLRAVYVCDVTPAGLANCQTSESP